MVRKRMQRLVGTFSRIVKLNPSYLAFLSGLFVSISINLLTDLVFGNPKANLIKFEWLILFAFLIASLTFAALASDLEKPHQHWVLHWRDEKNHNDLTETEVINGAVRDRLPILIIELLIGSIASITGIVLLFYSYLAMR